MADKSTQQKIEQLQQFEQSLQNFLAQKQSFESQRIELDAAQKELESVDEAYKLIGNIMVLKKKTSLTDDIAEKKKIADLRIKSIEKQEETLRKRAKELQAEVLGALKKEP